MKIRNKILSFVLALCLIIPCALVFTACGKDKEKPTFTVSQNVLTSANDTVHKLSLIYKDGRVASIGANTTFNLQHLKSTMQSLAGVPEDIKNMDYYVNVGKVDGIDDINSITLGSTFVKDQNFSLSMGGNAFLQAKAYYEEDDNLYVAAPIIVFETVNLGKIKINDVEFGFDLQVEATAKNFSNVKFQNGATSEITKVSNAEYNLNLKEANRWVEFYYDGATANDVMLTKKVMGNNVNYGLTTVEALTGNPLGLYPISYSSDALTQEYVDKYDGKTMIYSAYCVRAITEGETTTLQGFGIYSVKLNFDITLPVA